MYLEGMRTAAWEAEQTKRVGGVGQGSEADILNRWEDNLANIILGMDHNSPLAYTPVLEISHLILSMLGGNGVWLERERYRERDRERVRELMERVDRESEIKRSRDREKER